MKEQPLALLWTVAEKTLSKKYGAYYSIFAFGPESFQIQPYSVTTKT